VRHPTLTDIASRLGISKMTVSRALRGGRHVTADLRGRILQMAAELGYRPDPEIAKLMTHMRSKRQSRAPQTLALVWSDLAPGKPALSPWSQQLLQGASHRADELGYKLEEFHLAERGMDARRMSTILEARGIRGLVLSPLLSRSRGHLSMDWHRFASVVIGLGYARPVLHRVHHHHFIGMMTAMRRLKKLGYRRIGFFSNRTVDERMFGAWSASFLTHHPLPVEQASEMLCLERTPTRHVFAEWLRRAKPEVVIDGGQQAFDWLHGHGMPMPGEIGYATLSWTSLFPERAGMDQQAEVLGAAAIDLLAAQITHNEHGIPAHPKIVMTEGVWREGKTVRRVR
jgi:DNA-binding LacI/PurR family transcriptional regulator